MSPQGIKSKGKIDKVCLLVSSFHPITLKLERENYQVNKFNYRFWGQLMRLNYSNYH